MSGPDEKPLPWTEHVRGETGPWENHLRVKTWKGQYRENFTIIHQALAPSGVLTWHMRLIIIAAILVLQVCFIAGTVSPTQWFLDTSTEQTVAIDRDSYRLRYDGKSSAVPNDHVFDWKPAVQRELAQIMEVDEKGFLSHAAAEVFCKAHGSELWKGRSKRRKIYELIYFDANTHNEANQAVEALETHLGLRYHDVDYFVIVESRDGFEFNSLKPLWLRPDDRQYWLWEQLWPYHEKMIYHAIQPKSDPSKVLDPYPENFLGVETVNNVKCERKTQEGDSIAVRYTAWFGNGTFIGSNSQHRWFQPVVFTLGTSKVKGWNEGLKDMCIGEKRVLNMSPYYAYGPDDTGPIPGNSTLVFETELVSIKGVGDEWQEWYEYTTTQDPLMHERQEFAYNAMYSQVIPYLVGEQKIEQGDVIMMGNAGQIPTTAALAILRNCDFPRMFQISSQVNGYVFRGMGRMKHSQHLATFFDGDDTVLPQTLREADYYNHGDHDTETDSNIAYTMAWTEYCGPCYGATSLENAQYPGCCNTCEGVKDAYEAQPWAVGSAYEHVEQCIRERKPYSQMVGFE